MTTKANNTTNGRKGKEEKSMVTFAIIAAIMGIGGAIIILALYAFHRLTGGKMTLKKWFKLNFEF